MNRSELPDNYRILNGSYFDDEGDMGNGGGHFHYYSDLQVWMPEHQVTRGRWIKRVQTLSEGWYTIESKHWGWHAPSEKNMQDVKRQFEHTVRAREASL